MTDPNRLSFPDSGGGLAGPDHERPPPTPRWVKLLAVVGAVIIAIVLTAILLSGGAHGPGRHVTDGNAHLDASIREVS